MTHPPLFQLIGSPDKKTQGFPLPLPQPSRYGDQVFFAIRISSVWGRKGGQEKMVLTEHFFKQQRVFFYFCLCNFTYLSFVFAFLPVAAWSARYCSEWSDGLIRDQWCSFCNKIWPGCTTPHFLLGARLTDVMWRWGYPPRSSQLFPR